MRVLRRVACCVSVVALGALFAFPAGSIADPPIRAPSGSTCTFAKGISTCTLAEQRVVREANLAVGGAPDSFVRRDCPIPTPPGAGFGPYAGYYNVTYTNERTVTITYRGMHETRRTFGDWQIAATSFEFTGRCFAG